MEQEWTVHREVVPYADGQRRWDLAYQCLLKWSTTMRQETSSIQTQQEACDESGNLCPSVDPTTSADPDH